MHLLLNKNSVKVYNYVPGLDWTGVKIYLHIAAIALTAFALHSVFAYAVETTAGAVVSANERLGLPIFPSASDSSALVSLGRRLFFDKRLSRDGSVACSTCHAPALAFSDGRALSVGVFQATNTRNAPSLLNLMYTPVFMWDGRRTTLDEQVVAPFTNAREHGLPSHADLLALVRTERYREDFVKVFPGEADSPQLRDIHAAIAAYIRTLRAGDSAFDRYFFAGDKSALTETAKRGLELFRGPARCTQCHEIESNSALFTDHRFHRVGIGGTKLSADLAQTTRRAMSIPRDQLDETITADGSIAALGRFLVTRDPKDIGKYRTPSLRNVALTAPYMHDGSVATLREAIDSEVYYRSNESGRPLILTPRQREDLLAFLNALTSACFVRGDCTFTP